MVILNKLVVVVVVVVVVEYTRGGEGGDVNRSNA